MTRAVSRIVGRALAAFVAVAVAGCSLDNGAPPALSGPSEFALSITMTASPDQLSRGSGSVSTVTLTARDEAGRPVSGQLISLTLPENAPAGARLSASQVVTNSSGIATFTVTAPVAGSVGDIIIEATPVGDNADNTVRRSISIAALPSNDSPPNASISFTPTSPEIGQTVTFVGTATDEGVACTNLCTFSWNFGDGTTASGQVVNKTFTERATFPVVLVVTDRAGTVDAATQNVVVGAIGVPTSVFTFSPNPAVSNEVTTFDASNSVATGSHRIVSYSWSWGDGSTNQTSNPVIRHTFSSPAPYVVELTVRDELGQATTSRQTVDVGTGIQARFDAEVDDGRLLRVDGSASSTASGATIIEYRWNYGDSTSVSSPNPTDTHTYHATGTYTVTLTVIDNSGRSSSTQRSISIP